MSEQECAVISIIFGPDAGCLNSTQKKCAICGAIGDRNTEMQYVTVNVHGTGWYCQTFLQYLTINAVLEIVESMYIGEPCRICGEPITKEQIGSSVWAGYSENNEACCAHGECWKQHKPQATLSNPA